jgi:tripartite ATP-independent transporter DctM subunit
MLGRTVLPMMLQRGYDTRLTLGTIMGGALLAPIIPPSVLAILIGTIASVSIGDLLIAGVIPGLVLAVLYAGVVVVALRRNPALAPRSEDYRPSTLREKVRALVEMLPFSAVIFVSIGLIVFDFATPSEAAALGALAAFAESLWHRRMKFADYVRALSDSAVLSAVILVVMATAVLFGQVLNFTGAIQALGAVAGGLDVHPMLMFFILMLIPFVLCMFVDQIALILVLIPIYDPLVKQFGFDPVWFYMLLLINLVIGAITPPFGYVLFALKAASPKIPMSDIYAAAWMFTAITVAGMVVFSVFPGLVTFLPQLMK